mgnify:CR=1|tara:strand:- start:3552 stop:4181 length:630 start_codon:yes stop_codon:yes gene_type:complete
MGLSSGNSLASAAEGGGASGVSASQVSNIIQAQNEYEFITKVQNSGNINEHLITAGIDHTKYERHKYIIRSCQWYANNYLSWHLLQADGQTRWSHGGAWQSRYSTQNRASQSSISSSSYLYFDGQQRNSNFNATFEIELIDNKIQSVGTGDYYITAYTRTSMGYQGGYWNMHSDGNAYFRNPNGDEYGGISLREELRDVTVLIYGMRRR